MKKLIIPAIVLVGLLTSCGQTNSKEFSTVEKSAPYADEAAAASAKKQSEISLDSTREYLQTAAIKMQVKKLQETKEQIRQIVRQQKGFILSSELENTVLSDKTVAISNDSATRVMQIALGNSYSLKIPARNLDTTIFLLEKIGVHIDNSSLKAEDITMQWLQNSSLNNDNTIDDLRKVHATNGAGIDKVMTMHELRKQQKQASLDNQELAYNIRYSDLKLDIYESPLVKTLTVANTDHYNDYQTPFGYALKNAFAKGIELFKTIIIVVAQLWLLILLAIAGIITWKTIKKRRRLIKA